MGDEKKGMRKKGQTGGQRKWEVRGREEKGKEKKENKEEKAEWGENRRNRKAERKEGE